MVHVVRYELLYRSAYDSDDGRCSPLGESSCSVYLRSLWVALQVDGDNNASDMIYIEGWSKQPAQLKTYLAQLLSCLKSCASLVSSAFASAS